MIAKDSQQAMEFIMAGLAFYLRTKTILTLALLAWLLFGGFVGIAAWYFKDSISIQKAEPISSEFSLMPQAFAGGQPILINGKTYGYMDPSFDLRCWKLAGESVLLVYDVKSGLVLRMDAPGFGNLKRYK